MWKQGQESLQAYLWAFWSDWLALMSGIASVVLTAVGAVSVAPVPSSFFWIAAGFCFVIASYRIWLKEHQQVVELTEKLNVHFSVYEIPQAHTLGQRLLLFVPEVTIINRSRRRTASLGVELRVPMGRGGIAHLPPESMPVEEWQQSPDSARNHCLIFPLNLTAGHTASGYIAFGTDRLKGVRHVNNWENCEIQFTDFHTGQVVHRENVRFMRGSELH